MLNNNKNKNNDSENDVDHDSNNGSLLQHQHQHPDADKRRAAVAPPVTTAVAAPTGGARTVKKNSSSSSSSRSSQKHQNKKMEHSHPSSLTTTTTTTTTPPASSTSTTTLLPSGNGSWEVKYDPKTGKPFYIDHQRKLTSWTLPITATAATTSTAPAAQQQAQQPQLPNHHWEEKYDSKTGKITTWSAPTAQLSTPHQHEQNHDELLQEQQQDRLQQDQDHESPPPPYNHHPNTDDDPNNRANDGEKKESYWTAVRLDSTTLLEDHHQQPTLGETVLEQQTLGGTVIDRAAALSLDNRHTPYGNVSSSNTTTNRFKKANSNNNNNKSKSHFEKDKTRCVHHHPDSGEKQQQLAQSLSSSSFDNYHRNNGTNRCTTTTEEDKKNESNEHHHEDDDDEDSLDLGQINSKNCAQNIDDDDDNNNRKDDDEQDAVDVDDEGEEEEECDANRCSNCSKNILQQLPAWLLLDDVWAWIQKFRSYCGIIVNSSLVQNMVLLLIILNAIMLGLSTFEYVRLDTARTQTFQTFDEVCLTIFTVELCLQFVYHGWHLFTDGWLLFDTFIIVFSWSFSGLSIVRAFRIVRALRLITRVQCMKNLIRALISVIPRIGAIFLLLCLINYIFAVMFTQLWKDMHENGVTDENYFGGLGMTFFTLFQIMTMDSWSTICRQLMAVQPLAWLPITSYVVLSAFVIMNLIIAVLCDAISALGDEQKAMLMAGHNRHEDGEGTAEEGHRNNYNSDANDDDDDENHSTIRQHQQLVVDCCMNVENDDDLHFELESLKSDVDRLTKIQDEILEHMNLLVSDIRAYQADDTDHFDDGTGVGTGMMTDNDDADDVDNDDTDDDGKGDSTPPPTHAIHASFPCDAVRQKLTVAARKASPPPRVHSVSFLQ